MPATLQPEWRIAYGSAVAALLLIGGILDVFLLRRWKDSCRMLAASFARARRHGPAWRPADVAAVLGVLLLMAIPSLLVAGRTASDPATPATALSFLPMIFVEAAFLIVAWTAAAHAGGARQALGLTPATMPRGVRVGLLLGLAALPPVLVVAALNDAAWKASGLNTPLQPAFEWLLAPHVPAVVKAALIVTAVLLAPAAEEAVFRGVLLPALLRGRQAVLAVLLVSLLFGLLHFHAPSFLPLVLLGVVFAVGRVVGGSVLTPIMMHACFNIAALLIFAAQAP